MMRNKIIFWILFAVLVSSGASLRFARSLDEMPVGCDEFGYLNLAKAFHGNKVISNHFEMPYLYGLLDTLRSNGISENEIAWMITPHAYHLMPETSKIINQYPPATSFLLSWLPLEWRSFGFPLLVLLLLIIISAVADIYLNRGRFTWLHILFAVFLLLMIHSSPFLTELTRINSLAPTFGFLLVAGMVMFEMPMAACLLIAITVNFRTANALMLVPLFVAMMASDNHRLKSTKPLLFWIISGICILPLLIYQYLVTGNPFKSTYSVIDTSMANAADFFNSMQFYFSFSQHWFIVHLILMAVLVTGLAFRWFTLKMFLLLCLFPVVNYIFFLTHKVNMDYYPYASAMILTGTILSQVNRFRMGEKSGRIVAILCLVAALYIFGGGLKRFMKYEHNSFEEAMNRYRPLCEFDLVWADLYSGTSSYVCDNNGFRYGTTTPRARTLAIKYLYNHNFKQAILLSDIPASYTLVKQELDNIGVNYQQVNLASVGPAIVIANGF